MFLPMHFKFSTSVEYLRCLMIWGNATTFETHAKGDNYPPDVVEAILEDDLPDHLTLFDLALDSPALWEE